jgi:hypothetical protein
LSRGVAFSIVVYQDGRRFWVEPVQVGPRISQENFLNQRPLSRRSPHRDRIDIESPRDVFYWAGTWGLSDQELRDAVAAVGPMAADVAEHLGQPLMGEDLGRGRRSD